MYYNILSPRGRPVKQLPVAHKKSQSPGASGRALSAHPAFLHPTALATDNSRAPHYQRAPRGGCCLGGGGANPLSNGLTPTLREIWSCHRALETLCHAWIATSSQIPRPCHRTSVKADMVLQFRMGYDSQDPIDYLDQERDRAYTKESHGYSKATYIHVTLVI